MATPIPSSIPVPIPPGPSGPGPYIFLVLLLGAAGYLWYRVHRELRRPPREEPDDVA